MVKGRIVVCVGDHDKRQLLVRVDPERIEHLLKGKGATRARMGSRTMKGWIGVSLEGVDSDEALASWVNEALSLKKKD